MNKSTSEDLFQELQLSHKILQQVKPYWSILVSTLGEPEIQYIIKFYVITKVHEHYKKTKETHLLRFLKVLAEETQEIKKGISQISKTDKYENINKAVFLFVDSCDKLYEDRKYSMNLINR